FVLFVYFPHGQRLQRTIPNLPAGFFEEDVARPPTARRYCMGIPACSITSRPFDNVTTRTVRRPNVRSTPKHTRISGRLPLSAWCQYLPFVALQQFSGSSRVDLDSRKATSRRGQ